VKQRRVVFCESYRRGERSSSSGMVLRVFALFFDRYRNAVVGGSMEVSQPSYGSCFYSPVLCGK
jgi:hypothetical protein